MGKWRFHDSYCVSWIRLLPILYLWVHLQGIHSFRLVILCTILNRALSMLQCVEFRDLSLFVNCFNSFILYRFDMNWSCLYTSWDFWLPRAITITIRGVCLTCSETSMRWTFFLWCRTCMLRLLAKFGCNFDTFVAVQTRWLLRFSLFFHLYDI